MRKSVSQALVALCALSWAAIAGSALGQTVVINTGIDTTLAESGLNGPDLPHGEAGTNPDGVERWEFDGADAGGVNIGLLWMDIPQDALANFTGVATLALHIDNNGNAGNMHRMTVDWLSGPDGGNEVTWNNIPGGPGVTPGVNAEATPSAMFPDTIGRQGQVIFVDVTADVAAWASGTPNYGWAFLPIGTDGTGITSFENLDNPVPTLTLVNQPGVFPSERLAGPLGTPGQWAVIDYYGDFTATQPAANVVQQVLQIQNGELQASAATANVPILDITDPDTNPNGGPVLTGAPLPYPSNDRTNTAPDDDDIISVAHGRIRVSEAGKYTFNVHSDDGFAFRIRSAEFESVGGNGAIDSRSPDTVFHAGNTADSDTRAVVQLEARDYDVEFLSWERAGGAFYELTASKGEFANGSRNFQPQLLAVGDPRVLPERTANAPVSLVGNAVVINVSEDGAGASGDVELAQEIVLDSLGVGHDPDSGIFIRDDVRTVVLADEGTPCCGRPGQALYDNGGTTGDRGDAYLWPLNNPDFGGDLANFDNFSSGLFGQLQVDDGDEIPNEELEITFGMFADDGAQFHVKGASFEDGNANADLSFEIDGDTVITFPTPTGNTNTLGLITLREGEVYDWQGFHYENGGDAGYEIWAALGDHIADGFDSSTFFPLSNVLNTIQFASNVGFTLVDEGAVGLPGDYDGDGQLDVDDLNLQAAAIQSGDGSLDLDGDGDTDLEDRKFWIQDLRKTWMGDANLDGVFSTKDLIDVFQAGKFEQDAAATWDQGDWDGNGRFQTTDLVVAFQDGGFEKGPRAAVSAVPEPSSALLILVGLVSLARVTRQRQRR